MTRPLAAAARGEWARQSLLTMHSVAGVLVCALIVIGGPERLTGSGYTLLRDLAPWAWPYWWAALAGVPSLAAVVGLATGRPMVATWGMAGLTIWFASGAASLCVAAPGRQAPIHPIAVNAAYAAGTLIHAVVLREESRARAAAKRAASP